MKQKSDMLFILFYNQLILKTTDIVIILIREIQNTIK